MKILYLRKKINVNFSISAVLFLLLAALFSYNFYKKSHVDSKVKEIKSETSKLKSQASELKTKISEAEKYRNLWSSISSNKKSTSGIKMDNVNALLSAVSEKYSILKPSIKVALPEAMKDGIFKRKTVTILSTTATLSFEAVNDIKALLFVDELLNSLPGYIIITNFEIKKSKQYSDQDLVALSSGNGSGAILGKIDFFWYTYKDLEKKKEEDAKADNSKKSIMLKETLKGGAENAEKPTP